MTSKKLILFISTLFLIVMYSCEKSVIEYSDKGTIIKEIDTTSTDTTGGGSIDSTNFKTEVLPIFTSKCASCHGSSFNPSFTETKAFTSLTSGLVDVSSPSSSKVYKKITEAGGSHEGRSTVAENKIILTWIKEGAKNN